MGAGGTGRDCGFVGAHIFFTRFSVKEGAGVAQWMSGSLGPRRSRLIPVSRRPGLWLHLQRGGCRRQRATPLRVCTHSRPKTPVGSSWTLRAARPPAHREAGPRPATGREAPGQTDRLHTSAFVTTLPSAPRAAIGAGGEAIPPSGPRVWGPNETSFTLLHPEGAINATSRLQPKPEALPKPPGSQAGRRPDRQSFCCVHGSPLGFTAWPGLCMNRPAGIRCPAQ